MAGHQLTFKNGEIHTIQTTDDRELLFAPLVVLDCEECPGWTQFEQESATQTVCRECGRVQGNERIVDLNDERL